MYVFLYELNNTDVNNDDNVIDSNDDSSNDDNDYGYVYNDNYDNDYISKVNIDF